jgi:predicted murein hydrolase (TIGR00659 family)
MRALTTTSIWVYLSANPLLWLTATLVAYALAERLARRWRRHPLANPVAMATAFLAVLLVATDTPYETFFDGAQFVHFLLGPATVALAVPLYRNLARIKARLLPMGAALLCGSVAAILSAVATAALVGAPHDILVSLAPKSVTTPIAMSLAEGLGGVPTLTAVLVIVTGIFGAMVLTPLMRLQRVSDPAAVGFAAGLAAHGIGAARAFQIDATAGAFAGIGLGLNGAMTAVLLPVVLPGVLAWVR